MPPPHAFRELEQHHPLVLCGPAYHKRRGTPYWDHPPVQVLDPLKQDHLSGCANHSHIPGECGQAWTPGVVSHGYL